MRFSTLEQWLDWQTTLHPSAIDLGLERCRIVAQRLNLLQPTFPIITVAGTNGKGSSVAFLETILTAAGYRVASYTSPHLLRYNERIRIAGQPVTDTQLCDAFEQVDKVRQTVSLTYFEFGTLAAMLLFKNNPPDVAILEVGLGGRLDAVNVFDPTIALVTAIGIDHVAWLGTDRESIGWEKAGIFRPRQPAVCADNNPPLRLLKYADYLNTPLYYQERNFIYNFTTVNTWKWQCATQSYRDLPLPALQGQHQLQNASGVLMVIELLKKRLPVAAPAIHQGLRTAFINGRFQIIVVGDVTCILDVAHNPQAATALSLQLSQQPCEGKTYAITGILNDKDIIGILTPLRTQIAQWHVAELDTPRTASKQELLAGLEAVAATQVQVHASITTAFHHVLTQARIGDRIVVFGSFYTVAEVLRVARIYI